MKGPAKTDLRGGLHVFCGEDAHHIVVEISAAGQRSISLNLDPLILTVFQQFLLVAVRVEFNLIYSGNDPGIFFQFLQMPDLEIADADGLCLSGFQQFFHCFPSVEKTSGNRPVNEVQIHVIQLQPLQASAERILNIPQPLGVVPDFGCDEQVFAGDAALSDSPSDGIFVA